MSVLLSRGKMRFEHTIDPKKRILDACGEALDQFEVFYNHVLVGVYEPPKEAKTVSGLYLPDKTRDESLWQSRSCLVLKLGPQAFMDEGDVKFHGQRVDVGDWVVVRAADGQSIEVGGQLCRLYRDTQIIGRIKDPDSVW